MFDVKMSSLESYSWTEMIVGLIDSSSLVVSDISDERISDTFKYLKRWLNVVEDDEKSVSHNLISN